MSDTPARRSGATDAGRPRSAIEMLRRLVAFDTTSRNSNLDLIEFVRDILRDHGIDSRLTHDVTGRKASRLPSSEW